MCKLAHLYRAIVGY